MFAIAALALLGPKFMVLKSIPLGGDGGWDYLTLDAPSHRLFVTRSSHVMVLDVISGKVIGDISNTPGVHGVALIPGRNKGYTSNGRDNTVTVFDLKTLKETKRISVGQRPDAIIYDSASDRVFTFNAGTVDSTAIDAKTDAVVGSVKLSGKPEFPQVDGKGKLWVNIEDKNEIQAIDTKALKVVKSWSVAPGDEPSGLAYDAGTGSLFSVCGNGFMAISDVKKGKVVASPKIGKGPDAAAFDPVTKLAFSSNGEDGTLTVVGPDHRVVSTVSTKVGARTMALDPKTHLIYLITAEFLPGKPGERRPKMKPGTAVILVVGSRA